MYGTIYLSIDIELHAYFICPLYITAIFPIHKLEFCLWNKFNTYKTEPKALTNTSISWYDIKAFGIYRGKEDA